MRILTWNINSVRLRIDNLRRVMKECDPDIICLQETKTVDETFPLQAIKDAGYKHVAMSGMKSYNGVAIISRVPFSAHDVHHRCGREDCRHIAAKFKNFELHNLYIPAGGDIPDPVANDKFKHKLDFVDEMTGWFKKRYKKTDKLIAVGDFNIAPFENDVWSHKQLLTVVSHTPPETTRLNKMLDSLDWIDTARHFIPPEEKLYTWWSYRNQDWKKSNRGRRLDHIWVTQPLKKSLQSQDIHIEARDWDKPSDHVPVMVDLKIAA
ncbi:MAG: exodeoxyribonuclease III [Alphaproteobacteria bacterium]|jgi:exodeoxyribonuclease-3|nr:exodeoxyribonuclease III [Alphaproteobacteria bacterium]